MRGLIKFQHYNLLKNSKLVGVFLKEINFTLPEFTSVIQLDKLSSKQHPKPRMFPSKEQFDSYTQQLGLYREDNIVFVSQDPTLSTRCHFIFNYFGFQNTYIIDNFLQGYLKYKNSKPDYPEESQVTPIESILHIVDKKQIMIMQNNNQYQLLDTRQEQVFKSGSIPGSINIPFDNFLIKQTMQFKEPKETIDLLEQNKVDLNKKIIHTCNTGYLATLSLFQFQQLGVKDIYFYDGSYQGYI
ncbi:hypothetical protein pb186bvf_009021 [Paramecium bursaria]